MKPFFVDESGNVSSGHEAARMLKSKNDRRFFQAKRGVIEVNKTRWKEAQRYEWRTWMQGDGLSFREDRNSDHESCFNNYASIQGRSFHSALEIGCGPFTNMRHLSKHVKAKKITLLDPLINDYKTHPYCTYKQKRLGRIKVRTIAEPIESFTTDERFDLVIMVNVLEHCFSAAKVFERLLSLMASKGIFVFHDKLVPASTVYDFVRNIYDAGHPIRVADQVVFEFLSKNFDQLFARHVTIPLEDYMDYTFDSIYFIGTKREG